MVDINLSPLLSEHGLEYGLVVLKTSGQIKEFGDRSSLQNDGLVDSYILANPLGIFDFLDGKSLPQVVMQGRVVGIFSRPDQDVVVAVFTHRDDDALRRYPWSVQLDKEIAKMVGKP